MGILDKLKNAWDDNSWDENEWDGEAENAISDTEETFDLPITDFDAVSRFKYKGVEFIVGFNFDADGFTNTAIIQALKEKRDKKDRITFSAYYEGIFSVSEIPFFYRNSVKPFPNAIETIGKLQLVLDGSLTKNTDAPEELRDDDKARILTAEVIKQALINGVKYQNKKVDITTAVIGNDKIENGLYYRHANDKDIFDDDVNGDGTFTAEDFTLKRAQNAAAVLFTGAPNVKAISADSEDNIFDRTNYPKVIPRMHAVGIEVIFSINKIRSQF